MSTTPPPTPTGRPYTSYNLFFQLEREYILQTLLEFQPTIVDPKDLFDPTDTTNYQGPPLPPRYSNLMLPSDWHIPGKTQRRKRSHRKSHGKIGFHELNERISKAWQDVNADTKEYCLSLSELESKKYKKDKKEMKSKVDKKVALPKKKKQSKSKKVTVPVPVSTTKITKNELADGFTDLFDTFEWDGSLLPQQQDVNVLSPSTNHLPSPVLCRQVSRDSYSANHNHLRESFNSSFNSLHSSSGIHESFNTSYESFNTSFNSSLSRDSFTEVDMEDDEIIEMYKSMDLEVEEDTSIPYIFEACQVCVEIPQTANKATRTQTTSTQNNNNNNVNVLLGEVQGEGATTKEDDDNNQRMSFIDAEYEKFQEIGKHFSSGTTKMPGYLRRNSITACQA